MLGIGRSIMEIKMDDREKNPKIQLELFKLGIDCNTERLKIGDYIYKRVCIEMKSADDLCGSICDGRLEKQIEKMKWNYEEIILIIHGSLSKVQSKINHRCALGMYIKYVMDEDVDVFWVENEKQVAYCMKRIFERYDSEIKNLGEMKGGIEK